MSDEEPVTGEVVKATMVVPVTPAAGTVVDLSDRRRVAHTIAEIDEWVELTLKPVLAELRAALISEADVQAAFTLRYGDVEVKVDGPGVGRYEWVEDLRPMLIELAAAGLPPERCDEAVAMVTTFKVNHTEINRLCKVAKYAEIINRYRSKVPRSRGVKITRSR